MMVKRRIDGIQCAFPFVLHSWLSLRPQELTILSVYFIVGKIKFKTLTVLSYIETCVLALKPMSPRTASQAKPTLLLPQESFSNICIYNAFLLVPELNS